MHATTSNCEYLLLTVAIKTGISEESVMRFLRPKKILDTKYCKIIHLKVASELQTQE